MEIIVLKGVYKCKSCDNISEYVLSQEEQNSILSVVNGENPNVITAANKLHACSEKKLGVSELVGINMYKEQKTNKPLMTLHDDNAKEKNQKEN